MIRDGFREIAEGWMLIDDAADLADRVVRLIQWSENNTPLSFDERATLKFMIESLMLRELRERYGCGSRLPAA